jgi:hypothetical protein
MLKEGDIITLRWWCIWGWVMSTFPPFTRHKVTTVQWDGSFFVDECLFYYRIEQHYFKVVKE